MKDIPCKNCICFPVCINKNNIECKLLNRYLSTRIESGMREVCKIYKTRFWSVNMSVDGTINFIQKNKSKERL
jgi:hypothetical protein